MKAGMKNSQWLMVASANLSLLTVNYSGHIGNRWAIALGQICSTGIPPIYHRDAEIILIAGFTDSKDL